MKLKRFKTPKYVGVLVAVKGKTLRSGVTRHESYPMSEPEARDWLEACSAGQEHLIFLPDSGVFPLGHKKASLH
jgi:hypothetical protein